MDQTFSYIDLPFRCPGSKPVEPVLSEIDQLRSCLHLKVVVLDDDPTGTQTVYGIPVITAWDPELLQETLSTAEKGFFILTNSRSLPEAEAVAINVEIACRLKTLSTARGYNILLLSRGDSTLRGHFPAELKALAKGWGEPVDGYFLVPYFEEGGRYTIGNIHYVREGDQLIPVAETVYARDPVFAYAASNLIDYIYEKAAVSRDEIIAIEAARLNEGAGVMVQQLERLSAGQHAIVNASCPYHTAVLALALLRQRQLGKHYLIRCAASLVQSFFGIAGSQLVAPALKNEEPASGGLIVIGSFVSTTTRQLEHLLANTDIGNLCVDVPQLLDDRSGVYINSLAERLNQLLLQGRSMALFTSRELVAANRSQDNLTIAREVAKALVSIVQKLSCRPSYFVAKGGITSSTMATEALGIKKAMVKGQLLPGIPVWQPAPGSRFPGMPFVIFPGNVGQAGDLTLIYKKLTHEGR